MNTFIQTQLFELFTYLFPIQLLKFLRVFMFFVLCNCVFILSLQPYVDITIPRPIRVRGNKSVDLSAKSALDLTPNKFRNPYADQKPKSKKPFTQNGNNAGIRTTTINSFRSSPLWENRLSFQKIKKRTSHNIPIAHWSYKAHSLFYTEIRTITTVFGMSIALNP